MTDIIALSATSLEAFLLALIRTGGFLTAAPAISHRAVPIPVRIGLTLVIAVALVPLISTQLPDAPLHLTELVVIAAREMLTGVIICQSVRYPHIHGIRIKCCCDVNAASFSCPI